MVKVENIKVDAFEFKKVKSEEMTRCLKLNPSWLDLLPKNTMYEVSFELKETNSDIANGIRRCLTNEIVTKSLDYDEYSDADITDPNIPSDDIKLRIMLIPIAQEVDYADYEIALHCENKTDESVIVTSRDFIIKKSGKQVPVDVIMCPLIPIYELKPNEYLDIKNIRIIEGIGRTNAGVFSYVHSIKYDILDVEPLDVEKGTGKSSMCSNPTHFMIGYSTHWNIDKPLHVMTYACDTLIERFNKILTEFEPISNKTESYYSDMIDLETFGSNKEIRIKNENWTTINLIVRYCFVLTKGNIKFISASNIHPEKEVGVVRITHPEFAKLVKDAIKKITDDLAVIRKAFK